MKPVEQTPNLTLPYIMPSQAQKHVTHNEAIRMLDALVQMSVLDRDLATPPAEPVDGDRYLVAPDGTGEWAGEDGSLAAFQDGAWAFFAPRPGWLAWVADEAALLAFDGTDWAAITAGTLSAPAMFGINATADETNRLAICSPASLFEAEDGSHRLTINKQEPADTASIVLQTDHEGRAEIGLAGADDLLVKVSEDGETWTEALRVEGSGRVLMPDLSVDAHRDQLMARRDARERLTGDRTYYVRTDGSDANDGLADTSGGAFATVQKAFDVAYGELDLGIHDVTIQLADGTYAQSAAIGGAHLGSGRITLAGNASTPASTVLAGATGVLTLAVENGAMLYLRDLELRGADANILLVMSNATVRARGGLRFGSTGTGSIQIQCSDNATFDSFGYGYDIVGNTGRHLRLVDGGAAMIGGATIGVAGRAFSLTFVSAARGGRLRAPAATFSGSATGKRYEATENAIVFTGSGSATYLPGDVSGTTGTGGVYA
jgi:hypothetical protein